MTKEKTKGKVSAKRGISKNAAYDFCLIVKQVNNRILYTCFTYMVKHFRKQVKFNFTMYSAKEGNTPNILFGHYNNRKKGASELLTLAILLAIVVVSITIVLVTSQPTIDTALKSADIKNAENIIKIINDNILEVGREGPNSTRILTFTAPRQFETVPEDDAVQFRTTTSAFEYLTRTFRSNIAYITGDDVRCAEEDGDGDGDADLVMENQFIKGIFLLVKKTTPYAGYDTANTLLRVVAKTKNSTVILANSSVVIDDNLSTTGGIGYSEITNPGDALPLCQVHFFMDSAVDYDIYYKLYAGADFFVAEVRNIR